MTSAPQLLTLGEAAEYLRLHINTVRRWALAGRLPAYKLSRRGDMRFIPRDLERFVRSHPAKEPNA